MFSKPIEFLAIGDITTDAFIKLKNAHIVDCVSHENREICLSFGDKIPYEFVTVIRAVGNSANAAVAASRLGLTSALASNIGDDQNGRECLESLKKDSVNTKFISVHKGMETNYHYVLWYNSERTILVKHHEFPRTFKAPSKNPKWVYLSSIGDNSYEYQMSVTEWLIKNPDIKLAFQPGTFQMNLGVEKLSGLYKRSDIFFCNKEEAQKILNTEEKNILELSKKIQNLGPKIVVISDGPNGAYLYLNDELWHNPIYPDISQPLDRTGAGDAFSATFTSALALGKTPLEAFSWGPINSMSVVQYVGAQKGLLSREKLEKYLKTAPENYKITKIN